MGSVPIATPWFCRAARTAAISCRDHLHQLLVIACTSDWLLDQDVIEFTHVIRRQLDVGSADDTSGKGSRTAP